MVSVSVRFNWESLLLLQVQVSLADSDQYSYRGCEGCQYTACVCGEESRSFSWILTPAVLGTSP